jgi:biofilm PGA synthesis N-glycosyltransferase PgaC
VRHRRRLGQVTVAALVAGASSGHVLYPAWLAWRTRGGGPGERTREPRDRERPWPDVTVVVPAYRESGVIADKVEDLRANAYPGALTILVVADDDRATAKAAEEAGVRVLTSVDRLGKSEALNRAFAESDTPIVVISDANNHLEPGALAAVVGHFDDPDVGAVAGEKLEDDGGGGESAYWRFESWLKRREDELGTTIGLVGEFAAIRARAWRPIPAVANDDLWTALDIVEQGYRVAYEPRARAVEPPTNSLGELWERRTRMVSSALHIATVRRRQLRPSAGLVAAELWGHRLVRYTVSPLSHLALLALATSRMRSSRLARAFLLAHVCAGAGLLAETQKSRRVGSDQAAGAPPGRRPNRAIAAAGHVLFLQAVALGGLVRFLRGDRETKWTTLER